LWAESRENEFTVADGREELDSFQIWKLESFSSGQGISPRPDRKDPAMTTTTDFGSWTNHGDRYELTVESTVLNFIGGGDSDWRERVETSGAFDRMVSDYRDAIQAALPEGVFLTGNEFIGPYSADDYTWDGELDIHAIVESIDLGAIVDANDPDTQVA
jgi:hypothetical protein